MTHTPGHWGFTDVNEFGDRNIISSDGVTPIAIVVSLLRAQKETKANGRLIAAAPDLLAAIHGLLAITRWHQRDGEEYPEVTLTRQAIAKAEGS